MSPIEFLKLYLQNTSPGKWEVDSNDESRVISDTSWYLPDEHDAGDFKIAEDMLMRDAAFLVVAKNQLPALLEELSKPAAPDFIQPILDNIAHIRERIRDLHNQIDALETQLRVEQEDLQLAEEEIGRLIVQHSHELHIRLTKE